MKSKKVIFSLFVMLYALSSSAYDALIDGIYYNLSGSEATVTNKDNNNNSYSGTVVIPSSVTCNGSTYNVTAIGSYAFRECKSLTSISIPSSVRAIFDRAFLNCEGLTELVIPEGVDSIAEYAFEGLKYLQSARLPASIRSLGGSVFKNCTGTLYVKCNIPDAPWAGEHAFNSAKFSKVIIEEGVDSIGNHAFQWCSSVTSLTFPSTLKSIGEEAFKDCSGLTELTLLSNIESFGNRAFGGCSGVVYLNCNLPDTNDGVFRESKITRLVVGNGVTSLGQRSFCNSSLLASVTLPSTLKTIGSYAFEGLKSLISITLPSSLRTISDRAFLNCEGLTELVIPEGVDSIAEYAFEGLKYLQSARLPASIRSLGGSVFKNCTGTLYVKCNIPDAPWAGEHAFNSAKFSKVIIEEGVDSIGNHAFQWCSSVTSLTFPSTLKSIGEEAFKDCSGLTDIYCYAENTPELRNNAFANSSIANATLHVSPTAISIYGSTAPWSSASSIVAADDNGGGQGGDEQYENVVLNGSIIGQWNIVSGLVTRYENGVQVSQEGGALTSPYDRFAFYNNGAVEFLEYSNSNNSYHEDGNGTYTIVNNKFVYGGGDWDSFIITAFDGSNTMEIVFRYSDSKGYRICRANLQRVTDGGGQGGDDTGDNIIFADAKVKALCVQNWDTNGDGELSKTEAAAVKSLGRVFYLSKITSFDELRYFTGLTAIEELAFYESDITSVIIPSGVTSIGKSAFIYCNDLASLTLPDKLTSIEAGAFFCCWSLTSLYIPRNVSSISYDAFEACDAISAIIVDSGNSVYDSRDNCNAIVRKSDNTIVYGCKNTVIPTTVAAIGYGAFWSNDEFTNVTIPDNVTLIDGYSYSNCDNLQTVTIGSGIKEIKNWAFRSCKSLKDFYCYATTPPTTGSDIFKESPIASATLHVPEGSVNLYKSTAPWSGFGSIVAIGDEQGEEQYENVVLNGSIIGQWNIVSGTVTRYENGVQISQEGGALTSPYDRFAFYNNGAVEFLEYSNSNNSYHEDGNGIYTIVNNKFVYGSGDWDSFIIIAFDGSNNMEIVFRYSDSKGYRICRANLQRVTDGGDDPMPSGEFLGAKRIFADNLLKSSTYDDKTFTYHYDSRGYVTQIDRIRTDGSGKTYTISYGDKITFNCSDGTKWVATLNSNGFVGSMVCYKANGAEDDHTVFTYNADDQLTGVTYDDDEFYNITYSGGDIIQCKYSRASGSNYSWTYSYGTSGQDMILNSGNVMEFDNIYGVDLDDYNLLYYIGALGKATKHLPLSGVVDGSTITGTWVTDTAGRATQGTFNDHTLTWNWDNEGSGQGGEDPNPLLLGTWRYDFDTNSYILLTFSQDGTVRYKEYDKGGWQHDEIYSYSFNNNALKITDSNGNVKVVIEVLTLTSTTLKLNGWPDGGVSTFTKQNGSDIENVVLNGSIIGQWSIVSGSYTRYENDVQVSQEIGALTPPYDRIAFYDNGTMEFLEYSSSNNSYHEDGNGTYTIVNNKFVFVGGDWDSFIITAFDGNNTMEVYFQFSENKGSTFVRKVYSAKLQRVTDGGGEQDYQTDNILAFAGNLKANAGVEFSLPIELTNKDAIAGVQFDLYLPDGIELCKDEYDDYLMELSRSTTRRHSIASRVMSDGALRIVISSTQNATFSGNSGTILTLGLLPKSTMEAGNYTVMLKNIVLTDPDAKRYAAADVRSTITVMTYTMGDVNNDGHIDVADLAGVVRFILENADASLIFNAADMDGNGIIEINDYAALVNVILAQDAPKNAPRRRSNAIRNDVISLSDLYLNNYGEGEMTVRLGNNDMHYTGMQFDLRLPDGIELIEDGAETTDIQHGAWVQKRKDGTYRVVCASMMNDELSDGDVLHLQVKITGAVNIDHEAVVSNVVLTDQNAARYEASSVKAALNTDNATLIAEELRVNGEESSNIYDLSGRKINSQSSIFNSQLPKGLYIVNGKKTVVK